MENRFRFPWENDQDASSEKNVNLVQIIIVVSSSILSSSAVATVLKAWLDNRKTRLTIQIDGDKKKLEYEGHHITQDIVAIQRLLEQLDEIPNTKKIIGTTTIDLINDQRKEEYLLDG